MIRQSRAPKIIAALAAGLLTAALVKLWLARRTLAYSEEGQYFDGVVTYSDGAVVVFGAGAIVAGLVTVLLTIWAWRE